MNEFLHGVEMVEVSEGARVIRSARAGVVGVVGTAPVYQVVDKKINEPILIRNERDSERYFGKEKEGYTIPSALKRIFRYGYGFIIVVNVLDPSLHNSQTLPFDKTFTMQNEVNLVHEGVSNVTVKSKDPDPTTYIADQDYTVDFIAGKVKRLVSGGIPEGATVSIQYNYVDPSLITSDEIKGGLVDGKRTGMQALKNCRGKYGFDPKFLLVPKFCEDNTVAGEMILLANNLRARAIIDASLGTSYDNVLSARNNLTINLHTTDRRAILCYPYVKVNETFEPLSLIFIGVLLKKYAEKGYWWSPSNTAIPDATQLEVDLTYSSGNEESEVNTLNSLGIVTVNNLFGEFRIWGNRNASFPSDTSSLNFINATVVDDIIYESIEYYALQHIDKPLTSGLIDAIIEDVNAFLRYLTKKEAILGGNCWIDPAQNPISELQNGHLTFDYDFMPTPPTERITMQRSININYLKSLIGG